MDRPEARSAKPNGTSELRFGWPLVVTASVGFMTVPTTLPVYSLGVMTAPLQQSFGWSRGEIQAAVLFSTGLGVICAPIIGYLIRLWEYVGWYSAD